jgi:hypothetical protein
MLNEDFFYFFSMKEGMFAGDYKKNYRQFSPLKLEKIDGN